MSTSCTPDSLAHGLALGITDRISYNANPSGSELSMPLHTQLTNELKEFGDHPFYKNVKEDLWDIRREVHTILWRIAKLKITSHTIYYESIDFGSVGMRLAILCTDCSRLKQLSYTKRADFGVHVYQRSSSLGLRKLRNSQSGCKSCYKYCEYLLEELTRVQQLMTFFCVTLCLLTHLHRVLHLSQSWLSSMRGKL